MTDITPHNSEWEIIGAKIRSARIRSGYTQSAAAEKLGLTQSHLSMLEKGKRRLSAEMADKMSALYQTDDLTPFTDQPDNDSFAVQTVKLLEQLAEKSGSDKLKRSVDNYISLYGYIMLRTLYLTNSHNTQKFFPIDGAEMQKLRELLDEEPEKLARFAAESKEVKTSEIEPDETQLVSFLQIVRRCEAEINRAVKGSQTSAPEESGDE